MSDVLPEEAVNREPLSRFKYREARIIYDPSLLCFDWVVCCGHKSPREYLGTGATLEEAIFNAGIDSHQYE